MSNFNALMLAKNNNNINTPLNIHSDGGLKVHTSGEIDITGTHNNLFDGVAVINGTLSDSVDLTNHKDVVIFGNSDGVVDIVILVSPDNLVWYESDITISAVVGDFYYQMIFSGRYVRLKSLGVATLHATCQAK